MMVLSVVELAQESVVTSDVIEVSSVGRMMRKGRGHDGKVRETFDHWNATHFSEGAKRVISSNAAQKLTLHGRRSMEKNFVFSWIHFELSAEGIGKTRALFLVSKGTRTANEAAERR